MKKIHRALIGFVLLATSATVSAEPWLGNRYAQHCSACHAPARVNRPASERRCTLSCQGCHVNPNGGGIRTFYGNWNARRWVRSFPSDGWLLNKKRPAPFKWQYYNPKRQAASDENNPRMAKPPATGYPTVILDNLDYDEKDYDRSDGSEKIVATSEEKFLERVTADDPYRDERRTPVTGGGDLRFLAFTPIGGQDSPLYPNINKSRAWLMSVDLGVRYRPVPEHVNVVLEARFLGQPTLPSVDRTVTNEPRPRSAYVLIDDLPYNTYLQGGFYRPMFGLYSVDHDSLTSRISGLSQRAFYKSVGFGAAPNVPFVVFNLIAPIDNGNFDQSSGFVVNVGARWVTLGASLVFSYWSTSAPSPGSPGGDKLSKNMYSVVAGGKVGRFVLNAEYLHVKQEFAPGSADSGQVMTGDLRFRVWREIYAQSHFSTANVAMNLKEGSSSEFSFGARGFLLAGMDMELLFVNRTTSSSALSLSSKGVQLQSHFYF